MSWTRVSMVGSPRQCPPSLFELRRGKPGYGSRERQSPCLKGAQELTVGKATQSKSYRLESS